MKRIIVQSLLAFALGAITVLLLINERTTIQPLIKTKIVRDTIIEVQSTEPIVIERIKTKIIFKTDTLYSTPAFISRIDTIIQRDTIGLQYSFPQHTMSLMIRKQPISTEIRTINLTKIKMKERPWWEAPLYVAGGCGLGVLVGLAVRM